MPIRLIALLVLLCAGCKDKKPPASEEPPAWLMEKDEKDDGPGHGWRHKPEPPEPVIPGSETVLVAEVEDPGSLLVTRRGATFLVVWSTFWEGSIRARSYARDGTPIGESRTLVKPRRCPTPSGDAKDCAISGVALDVAANGSLVLLWSEENSKLDREKICIKCWPLDTRVQLFTLNLDPSTKPLTIDEPVIEEANTGGGLTDKAVVFAPDGSFMAAWIRDVKNVPGQIVTRAFDAKAGALGTPPRDPAALDATQRCPSLVPLGDGFVMAWSAKDGAHAAFLDGSFDRTGEPLRLSMEGRCPRIAASGDLLHVLLGEDPATWQAFSRDGAQGEPRPVPFEHTPAIEAFLTEKSSLAAATSRYVIASTARSGPIVFWESHSSDGKHHLGVHGQRFEPTGEPLGDPIVIDDEVLKWKTVDAIDVHAMDDALAIVWRQKKKIFLRILAI